METTPEEALGSNMSSDSISNGEFVHAVVKGKRTKRQRTQPPPPPATLSAAVADSFSASSAEAISGTITEEEEDMANCLILLAQGRTAFHGRPRPAEPYKEDQAARPAAAEKFTSRRLAEEATAADGKAGVYVYECKTCNRCFPSFQALGGHRTSHKKPKLAAAAVAEEKKLALRDDMLQISMNSFSSRAIPGGGHANAKPKVHECSICGSEFSSGQALGGHMRRHRPLAAAAESQEAKKNDKSFLSLDLNLPAPADDDLRRPPSPETTFSLADRKRQPLMFSATSASALVVDCHY